VLTLWGGKLELIHFDAELEPFVIRLCENSNLPSALRSNMALLIRTESVPTGFRCYVVLERDRHLLRAVPMGAAAVVLPNDYEYLADGDIVRLNPTQQAIRTLYRRNSRSNCLLLTERCNNYCLMCSQPPKEADDSWIVDVVLQTIPLIGPNTRELGFTGGEPTLLGDDLFRILRACKSWLPNTALHILSNGRLFADREFAQKYASIHHPDMMVGIPLYSDLSTIHDYVVQADGAYDDTIRGILNLKELRQKVEIRVVLHRQTYARLPQLAEFITRNLMFVDHVALMGLEMMGFTKANLVDLWIDPYDYQEELRAAVQTLAAYRMNVSIYNHQLCVLDRTLWKYARKSISDWKNVYMPECGDCLKKVECGGFFASAKLRYSDHIKALTHDGLEPVPSALCK
jgi:His-Xaa-Ser system radical SAM maturase HxsC